ncbi:MAG: hydrogenase nickel incorporation protein HypB [Desulfovermiculus sp.]|nr:hydrogenase nickel incorporation protein HypB [Desulfovermiculus sp.]
MQIPVVRKILEANATMADENKNLFHQHRVLALNLMSSPGAGKTALLERTLTDLKTELTMAVIEGDVQTTNDAQRIAATGAPVVQINTDQACHLDSSMIQEALSRMDLNGLDVLFIENVGNLVCPAAFDLGEDFKITLLSVPEGDDKPLKYPSMFVRSQLMILNKLDLMPYLDFDLDKAEQGAKTVNPALEVLSVSARTGENLQAWYQWVHSRVQAKPKT